MTDLLNQARNSNNNGKGKKMWTELETLALIVMKSQGHTVKEISKVTGHSENSVNYRFGRWCSQFENFAAILAHYKLQDKTVEEITEMVDQFIEERTATAQAS